MSCLLIGQSTSFMAVYWFSVYFVLASAQEKESNSPGSEGTQDDAASAQSSAPWFTVGSLWALVATLEFFFVLFFALFVLSINKRYIRTFFTTTTSKQFFVSHFLDAKHDQSKLYIFTLHPSYYKSVREDVKLWVAANYNKWNEEKPEWFTDRVKASIPLDMIPRAEE